MHTSSTLLVILLVLLSGGGFPGSNSLFIGVSNAQSCKQVVINTNSTTNGKLASTVPRVAQRLDVQANLSVLYFTAVFLESQEPDLTLQSVELYSDTGDGLQPRIPLANGSFNSTGAPITTTQFRFNATGGIALASGTSYWLVLAFVDGHYRELQGSTVPYNGSGIGGPVGLGRVVVEQGVWVESNEVVALSIDIFGCLQAAPLPSPTPLLSFTPMPSLPVASPSRSPTKSPTPSPSASHAPAVSPLATGVEVDFGSEEPTFDLSVPRSSGTKVGGSFLGLAVDGWSLDLQPYDVSVVNTTVGGAEEPIVVETHTYASLLADNATTFAQIFAFYAQTVDDTAFDALDLTIRPNTVKWSLNITTASGNALSLSQQPFSVSYRLADLTTTEVAAAVTATVVKRPGEPRVNMTTYYVPLTSSGKQLVAMVEVFDVALADGALVPLVGHDVRLASAALSRREQVAYELVLEFAPFNKSLYYDPSLGLGVLLGRSDASGGGNGDDDNLALVVATSVVIPLAFVLVVGAVVVGVAVLWWCKRRADAHLQHQIDQMRDNSAL